MDDFNDIKKLISSVLISSPMQMTIQKLDEDFCDQIGYPIPYRRLQFSSLEECLHSMNDILEVRGVGKHANIIVHATDKSAHIDRLVVRQKRKPPKKRRVGGRSKNFFKQTKEVQVLQKQTEYSSNFVHTINVAKVEDLHQKPLVKLNSLENRLKLQETEHSFFENEKVQVKSLNDLKNEVCDSYYSSSYSGTIPKTSVYQSNSNESADIYSSDEEEPVNTVVAMNVQKNLAILIDKYDDGVWCTKIPEIYREMFKKDLDYKEYGYKSLIQMCMELRSIFFCYRPDQGDFKLYDRTKPPPKDLDKHFKQSEYIKVLGYLNAQPSAAPAVTEIDELVNLEGEEYYPPDVVHLGEEISREFILDNQEDEYIDVRVGEVYDPSKFWVMLHQYSEILDQLMDEMQNFYINNSELLIPPDMIKLGLYCAAVYNNEYHRAIIVHYMPKTNDMIKVFYVDYGTTSCTTISKLCFLHRKFIDIPQQAIRARLACIYPPIANSSWTSESSSRFLDMVRLKNLVAQIYNVDYTEKILEIFLVDTSGKDDMYMNDALVREGHAIFTYEEQQGATESRFVSNAKYVHLIPNFDELEQGLVPNATEMIRLEGLGLSIEQILSHYFIPINLLEELQSSDTVKKLKEGRNDKTKSSVVARREYLKSLSESLQFSSDNDVKFSDTSSGSCSEERAESSQHFFTPEFSNPIGPPPGFESMEKQKIKITQKAHENSSVNTVITKTTNMGVSSSPNIISSIFQNSSLYTIPHKTIPTQSAMMLPSESVMNQLMLLKNQQAQMLPFQNLFLQQDPYSAYSNCSFLNTDVLNHLSYIYHENDFNLQIPYCNQPFKSLRLHLQHTIKELLLSENQVILNQFLFIIKERLQTPGVHHELFNLIFLIASKSVVCPLNTLEDVYKKALCLLPDNDILHLANEAKTLLISTLSNLTTPLTHHKPTDVEKLEQQLLNLNTNEESTTVPNYLQKEDDVPMRISDNKLNPKEKKSVFEIEFYKNKLHIMFLEEVAYVMVSEILHILDQKMPIERVRKCIVMRDPLISVMDMQLCEHTSILEDLSRYIQIKPNRTLHIVPITCVPKLINILGNRKDIASNFNNLLRKYNFVNDTTLIS